MLQLRYQLFNPGLLLFILFQPCIFLSEILLPTYASEPGSTVAKKVLYC